MNRQDQSKQRRLFGASTGSNELINHFKGLDKPDYSTVEIRFLLDHYDEMQHDLADDVTLLLNETNTFLNATTLEPLFKDSRDKSLDEQEFNEVIHKMALAIQRVDVLCKNQSNNKLAKEVLTDAADYAAECVRKRALQLKDAHDKIYELYKNGHLDVDLRKVIQHHHYHPTKP